MPKKDNNLHNAPVGPGSRYKSLNYMFKMVVRYQTQRAQLITDPSPIPALASPGTLGLALPSTHSYGYGCQSSAASNRTCPSPASGILVHYAD